jgi:hypothetical protein
VDAEDDVRIHPLCGACEGKAALLGRAEVGGEDEEFCVVWLRGPPVVEGIGDECPCDQEPQEPRCGMPITAAGTFMFYAPFQ